MELVFLNVWFGMLDFPAACALTLSALAAFCAAAPLLRGGLSPLAAANLAVGAAVSLLVSWAGSCGRRLRWCADRQHAAALRRLRERLFDLLVTGRRDDE